MRIKSIFKRHRTYHEASFDDHQLHHCSLQVLIWPKSLLTVNGGYDGKGGEIRRLSCPTYLNETARRSSQSGRGRLSVAEPAPSFSLESLNHDGDDEGRSPERRARVRTRLFRFRDEVERVCMRMRFAGTHLKAKLTPSKSRDDDNDAGHRRVLIEYPDAPRSRGRSKSRGQIVAQEYDDNAPDMPDHNFSTSLVIEPLKDGNFTASLPLDPFPTEDDIIVRVCNYKLEILLQKRCAATSSSSSGKRDRQHTVSRPFRCGDVDLPIYVDTASLDFTMDSPHTLDIRARTKFVLSRRLSISSDDLSFKKTRSAAKIALVRRTYMTKETSKDMNKEKTKNKNQAGTLQRQRSYTQ